MTSTSFNLSGKLESSLVEVLWVVNRPPLGARKPDALAERTAIETPGDPREDPSPEITDYLGIIYTPVNKVMMKTTMKENGYSNARPYLVIDMAMQGE